MRKLITLTCLTALLATTPALAGTTNGEILFRSLNDEKAYGEIQGRVQNCTNQNALENVLLHVPGKSIATRLSEDGSFHLHWVPVGSYQLDLEVEDYKIGQVINIPVKEGNITHLNPINVCITKEEKRSIRAAAPATESASKVRCPKGGFTCSSNWHNIKAKKFRGQESAMKTSEKKQPPVYAVNEELQLIRVQ